MNNSSFTANEITIEEAVLNYSYDHETGIIRRITKNGLKPIGHLDSRGYLSISYSSSSHGTVVVKAHRLAWALYYGEWPDNELDHINRNKLDNTITNLRLADRYINNGNRVFKPRLKEGRKQEIFNDLLRGVDPSAIEDLGLYFPYSFKNNMTTSYPHSCSSGILPDHV